jgi:polyadenylate-binding protein 2
MIFWIVLICICCSKGTKKLDHDTGEERSSLIEAGEFNGSQSFAVQEDFEEFNEPEEPEYEDLKPDIKVKVEEKADEQNEEEYYEEEEEYEDEEAGLLAASGGQPAEKELNEMKLKLAEMEEEAKKLQEMQAKVEGITESAINKEEVDSRSVFVGNVDFGTKPPELQAHFAACGTILRVTILCDKFTGQPKGFAYVEFMEKESVARAVELNESIFRGRPLKVTSKRTNVPFIGRRRRVPRTTFGAGFRRGGPRRRARRSYAYSPYY